MNQAYDILTFQLRAERDIVLVRQRARILAETLGFDGQDQTRISTAVSEIARNAFQYAKGGAVCFSIRNSSQNPRQQSFVIIVSDKGPGIKNLRDILDGVYNSPSGMGMGLLGAKRLMDTCLVNTSQPDGTEVVLEKTIPKTMTPAITAKLFKLLEGFSTSTDEESFLEIQHQNKELLAVQLKLSETIQTLHATNQELEETNRGVMALYTELDEKAEELRNANEVKTKFLSYMSHEFRTPVNSILGLSRILLDRLDGDLTKEQEKQVTFIKRAAQNILEMVNDLLDLAKVEAGKISLYSKEFLVSELLGALKGLMRPMQNNAEVELVFDEPGMLPAMHSDEGKVAQILRNLISNALKFTEKGEVRVSVKYEPPMMVFRVSDTGIGIALENQEAIFDEFSQIDSPVQRSVQGTGLGLPLVRKLTELLGGHLKLESELGKGSTFTIELPLEHSVLELAPFSFSRPALLIDDDQASRYLLRNEINKYFPEVPEVMEASNGAEGILKAQSYKPCLIFLDLVMPGTSGFEVLRELSSTVATAQIPVVIHTSKILTDQERQELSKNAAMILPKESSLSIDTRTKLKLLFWQILKKGEERKRA